MLESHNDTAVAVAEAVSGSTAAFARGDESRKAKEIGCTETHFVSPNGLDWEDEDGATRNDCRGSGTRLLRYCIHQSPKKEEFLKITQNRREELFQPFREQERIPAYEPQCISLDDGRGSDREKQALQVRPGTAMRER